MAGLDHVPDARDGLTLAERAVLIVLPPVDRPRKKCATTIRTAIRSTGLGSDELYDAIVRLVQPCRVRWPLIDDQGNFGSVDDDPPADAVYTEARLGPLAEVLGAGAASDPSLPLRGSFPQLLANGSWEGIAQIPPHHLGELAAALRLRIDDPACSLDDILAVMPGPDYPTGGELLSRSEIRAAYATGQGALRLRAMVAVEIDDEEGGTTQRGLGELEAPDAFGAPPEERSGGRYDWDAESPVRLVVTELPFGVLKGGDDGLIRQAVQAVHDRVVPEITDIFDESDRNGMRLVVGLKEDPEAVRDRMFELLDLEVAVPVLLVALVDGRPTRLSLLELLDHYLAHQREVRGTGAEVDAAIGRDLDAISAAHGNERRTRLPAG